MSEALICRRGSKGEDTSSYILQTRTISSNTVWEVPKHAGNVSVRIFGGGGGGGGMCGGGGGWMNNGEFELSEGQIIDIAIGVGGSKGTFSKPGSGGTTSFGIYLSANGGGGAGSSSSASG